MTKENDKFPIIVPYSFYKYTAKIEHNEDEFPSESLEREFEMKGKGRGGGL